MNEDLNKYTDKELKEILDKRNKAESNNTPEKTYRAGTLSLSVWSNENKDNKKFNSYTIQRSYKNDKDEWEHTKTLRVSDLPKLKVLIEEAYKSEVISEAQ